MIHTYAFDPAEILGLSPQATLSEIRHAYREQVKRYHPDAQGEAWAFRLVNEAYEILTRIRVADQIAREEARDAAARRPEPRPTPPPQTPPPQAASAHRAHAESSHAPRPPVDPDAEQVRTGVRDSVPDPAQVVDVDLLMIRFAVDDPMEFFVLPAEQRNLSCSLNLNWPSRRTGGEAPAPANPAPYLAALKVAFEEFTGRSHPVQTRSRTDGEAFMGWANFATATAAAEAFQTLKRVLNHHRLGVSQKTRELVLPRELLDHA